MALVVGVSVVVTEEFHRVVFVDVLGMLLDELLDTVPEGGNGLDVLVQADDKAVFLLVVSHELEGIVVNVAEQLDTRLDSPVPFVVHHQGLSEEEARFEPAHVTVTD